MVVLNGNSVCHHTRNNKVNFRLQQIQFANLDCRLLIKSINIRRQLNFNGCNKWQFCLS